MLNEFEERRGQEQGVDWESPFSKDRSRIIHSFAFRRLQGKTQVFGVGEGDFHRTRLTHSLEVAEISSMIMKCLRSKSRETEIKLLPTQDCIEAIGLAHDLGHPPFGHNGEAVLNRCMLNDGGFEGNGQTLRILSRLDSVVKKSGLNLTRRVLLGVLKYPTSYSAVQNKNVTAKPPKCYMQSESEVIKWIMKPFSENDQARLQSFTPAKENKHGKAKFHSFDTSIMELGDDISYGTHDLEDAVSLGLIHKQDFDEIITEVDLEGVDLRGIIDGLFGQFAAERKNALNKLILLFVEAISIIKDEAFEHPLLKHNVVMEKKHKQLLDCFKAITIEKLVSTQNVKTIEYKGKIIIEKIFEALAEQPEALLPKVQASIYQSTQDKRVICDYIAGMTDEYASRFYERLFIPSKGSIFERI